MAADNFRKISYEENGIDIFYAVSFIIGAMVGARVDRTGKQYEPVERTTQRSSPQIMTVDGGVPVPSRKWLMSQLERITNTKYIAECDETASAAAILLALH